MRLAIGVTGGIATGKSTVTHILQQQGYKVIDADQVARKVVRPHRRGWKKVVKAFGDTILQPDKQLDRQRLGQIVFNNPERLQQLNQILQPLIRQRLTYQIQHVPNDNRPVFFEIPLLFEQNYQSLLQKTILVYAKLPVQLQRLQERNHLSVQQAQQRINSQMDLQQKRQLADFVIDNSDGLTSLYPQIEQVLKNLLKGGSEK
ncbi:dephospho-CoA kinase [Bombilactobacillus bombi]|uniref:dephospho-CoA kinase n=1 Tax=Bombilactobacillus bombi TaxID=1303590 RepID=UPI0015E6257C|nr:dephospho-CoA kinase [Bombilactobacillus bombi]MBA1434570.1 dephospho-CoA kinase [Bombilactobacillus bombi]